MVYNNILINIFISISFFFLKTFQQNLTSPIPSYPCNNITDCFSCISSSICNWHSNTNSCINGSHSQFHLMFSQNQPCNDINSISTQNTFCGLTQLSFQNNKAEISLPEVSNSYGKKNLFCTFELDLQNKSTYITGKIQVNTKHFMDLILQIQVIFPNGNEERIIDSPLMGVKIKKGKIIRFYYYQLHEFQDVPFIILLQKEKTSISITLVLSIILIISLIVLCVMGIYLFKKRIVRKKLIQAIILQRIGENVDENQIQQNEEQNQKEKRMALIQMFIKNNLNIMKCNENLMKLNSNCTICLEEYSYESNVIKTVCGHVFHFKCIENWLYTNIMNAKCPNCNYFFLEEDRIKNKVKEDKEVNANRTEQYNNGNHRNGEVSNESNSISNQQNRSRIDNSNNNLLGNNFTNENNDLIVRLNKKENDENVKQLNDIQQHVCSNLNMNENNRIHVSSICNLNENNNQVKINKNLEVLQIYDNINEDK